MSFGSKTNSKGEAIKANGTAQIIVGQCVQGNTIDYFGMSKDQNGNPSETVAEIRFKQSNGATFSKKFFAPGADQDWAVDNLNRDMLHICTKIVPEEEYYSSVANSGDFAGFIKAIASKIVPKAAGKTFSLKIVYRENKNQNSPGFGSWFPSFPNFPNWIEVDGTTPSTFNTNPKYDYYSIPESAKSRDLGEAEMAEGPTTGKDEIDF